MCRFLNIGSQKKLRKAVRKVREFATNVVKEKQNEVLNNVKDSEDLLSRFLKSGHSDETFVVDIVISILLAGRDTTSSALTWFFWLIHNNNESENIIVKEIAQKKTVSVFEEVKDMVYTHAALCEAMRLYPPVPVDIKEAVENDTLPNGMAVKKGTWVTYHPYAMGKMERLWGEDCNQYRPERWLKEVVDDDGVGVGVGGKKWKFVGRDAYSYPVFHGGPRVCLGKEMAFLQMKRVVAGVLEKFRVVPVAEDGFQPVYVPYLTAKMHGGFMVRIEQRSQTD